MACQAVSLSRTVYRYQPDQTKDDPVIEVLLALAEKHPRYGFGKMFPIIRRRGYRWNHKRVYRIYCGLGLNIRRKGKRRIPNRNPDPLSVPESINPASPVQVSILLRRASAAWRPFCSFTFE